MAFYNDGNIYASDSQVINSTISNSMITTSSIDMNMQPIENLGTCTTNYQAANKIYVDSQSAFITGTITLSGVTPVIISPLTSGIYTVKITSLVLNGPIAKFEIGKSEPSLQPQIHTIINTPGFSTTTVLRLSWDPNSGITCRKTSNLFDGSYNTFII